jgi:CheY-like chemotaxis protein
MVAVSDAGTGMSDHVLERAFEPFFTTKEVGKGTGLGLSMVYGFVKQSHGHVTIYSEAGHGTTVKLYLPRSREAVAEAGAGDDTPESAPGYERILVVEDDPDVRALPVAILRKQGYQVVEAADGGQAIGHLKAGPPFDLLFTDVVLPGGMNGVEIAKEAKRLQPDIKVIFTTGYAEHALAHNGGLDPGTILVTKPYQRAELLKKVRAALGEGGD